MRQINDLVCQNTPIPVIEELAKSPPVPNREKVRVASTEDLIRVLIADDGPPEKENAAPVGSRDGAYGKAEVNAKNSTGKREEIQDVLDELIGFPALDSAIEMTFFPDQRARSKKERRWNLRRLAREIEEAEAKDKSDLPWVKLATFGDAATERGCLRNNDNVRAITGVEIDYDGGSIDEHEAAHRLRSKGIAGLVYSTPSSTPDHPKWRVLAPLSREHEPEERTRFVEMLNAVFDGEPDQQASFTLSQSFFYGNVIGRPPVRVHPVDGRHLDTIRGLPRLAKGKRKTADGDEVRARDDSGSAALFRLASEVKSDGGDLDDFRDRIEETPTARRHVDRVEKEQRGHGERAILRAWDKAEAHGGVSVDDFDDEGRPTVHLSDDELAAKFGERCADRLRFNETTGKWLAWDGGRWKPDAATDALMESRLLCRDIAKGDKRNKGVVSAGTVNAVVNLARTEPRLRSRQEQWDADPWMLGTPGGTVDLRTGKVRAARPEDLISRRTVVAPVPLDRFDPEEDCPEFLRFLRFACNDDPELVDYLLKWGGYALTGDTREQGFLFVYGTSGTGKSTLLNLFLWLLGDYGTHVDMGTLTQRRFDQHMQELARLEGARLVVSSETEANRSWAEARLKAITGGDPITANLMRENARTFLPLFKLMIAGNHRPAMTTADPAIERRINIVGFDRPPVRRDDGLMDRLKAEGPGILSLLIKACLRWQRDGLKRPKVVAEAVSDYFAAEDTFAQWVDEKAERGDNYATTTEALFDSWERYARRAQAEPGSRNRTFPEEMRRLGFAPIKDRFGIRGRGFRGLRLRIGDEFDLV